MRQKKSAITPQKYPSYNGIWNALLYRKYFELQLLKHAGLPIRRSTYKYGRFRSRAYKFLPGEILTARPYRDRDLLLTVLHSVKSPPKNSFRQVIIQEDSTINLADLHIANLVAIKKVGVL
jgi:hypothetical protein